jgi:hypothetical protein
MGGDMEFMEDLPSPQHLIDSQAGHIDRDYLSHLGNLSLLQESGGHHIQGPNIHRGFRSVRNGMETVLPVGDTFRIVAHEVVLTPTGMAPSAPASSPTAVFMGTAATGAGTAEF